MSEKTISLISRAFFLAAFALLALSVLEAVARQLGYTILRGTFAGGRLFEISAILVIFVIAMLLREIRDTLRSRSG